MQYLIHNIQTIRRRLRLSQTELAEQIDATRAQVSNWERGRTAPRLPHLQRLAALAGVEVPALVGTYLPPGSNPAAPDPPEPVPIDRDTILQEIKALHSRLDLLESLLRQVLGQT